MQANNPYERHSSMTYDFRRVAIEYRWYVQDNKPNRVVYGPYPSEFDARLAYLMTIPKETVNQHIEKYGSWWVRKLVESKATKLFVHTMSDDDIEYGMSDPGGIGHKSMKVKPPTALKRHPSWKGHDEELTRSWVNAWLAK